MHDGMSNCRRARLPLAALLSTALLAACAVGPDYERPRMDMPQTLAPEKSAGEQPLAGSGDANAAAARPGTRKTGEAGERWWTLYQDPVLDKLENEAREHNASVQAAVANVLLARAQLGVTEAGQYPTVTANARATRTKMSAVGTFPFPPGAQLTRNLTHISLDASYELDLWGKNRRARESAQASVLSAEALRDAAYLSLSAQVAQQYFALLAADAQDAVLQRALAGRQEMIALDRKKVEVGVMSDYDLHQAEADEASIRAQRAAVAEARDRQEAALAVLLGRSPREVMSGTIARGTPQLADVWVPEGLPSDLLLRRPDLQAAELNLVALNAQIGVARAQYFPSLTLTGYLGAESTAMSQLFTSPARIFQLGAGISQPITDAIFGLGRVGYLVDAAKANRERALAQYRQAVADAFADLRNALTAQDASRQILDAESSRSHALSEAYRQAELRYKAGIASRLEVLDVEKNYLQADLNRIDAQRAQRSAVADLFKALGGGWKAEPADRQSAAPNNAKSGSPAPN